MAQFSASPDLQSEFVGAVIGAMASSEDLSTQILNNSEISQKLLGEFSADYLQGIEGGVGVRIHDPRYTFAVQQLSAGTHFMQVSKWLGHSTYTLTLDVYGDYSPNRMAARRTRSPNRLPRYGLPTRRQATSCSYDGAARPGNTSRVGVPLISKVPAGYLAERPKDRYYAHCW